MISIKYRNLEMKRIFLGIFYKLNQVIHPLTDLAKNKQKPNILSLIEEAYHLLEALYANKESFLQLKSSHQSASRLYGHLDTYLSLEDSNRTPDKIKEISDEAKAFEIAFVDELSAQPAYLVTPKGGYSLDTILSSPEKLFHNDLLSYVPAVQDDIEQAAKCLAFEVPTAAAFHLFRIIESVVRTYWDFVTDKKDHPEQQNLGVYLNDLEKEDKADKKIISTLKHIKDLYRNPITHPQESLTVDTAIALFGIVNSAIIQIIEEMKN